MNRTVFKYFSIAMMSARSNLVYLGEVGSRTIFLTIVLYIFLQLWRVTYSETHSLSLGGLTLTQMLWYLMVTESIILSGPRVSFLVDDDVRTGALAVQLVRPISYPLYRFAVAFGERLVRFALNFSIGSVIALLLVGPLSVEAHAILFLALMLPLSFTIDFLACFLIGTFAFWLEDTSGLFLIYSRAVMILGGMLIPIELFPESIKPLIQFLPFKSMVYGPAKMFVAPDFHIFLQLLTQQLSAALIFAFVVGFFYRTAIQRINVQGG